MKPKLINFSWTPGPARSLVPVIRKVSKENRIEVISIGYGFSEKVFNEDSISYKTLKDYGIDSPSINSIDRLLEITGPQIVVTGTSPEQEKGEVYNIEQASIYAAKKRKIPSLTVVDIWMQYPRFFDDLASGEKFKYLADKVGVLDESMKEDMLQEGFDEKNLIVTGNPSFDQCTILRENFKAKDRENVRKDLGIGPDSYLFLYASGPIEDAYGGDDSKPTFLGYTEKTVLRDIISSMKKISEKNKTLLVKIHPREEKENLESIIKDAGADFPIVINKGYNTRQAILASDAILSSFSTVLLESVHLDKPAISIQPNLKKKDTVLTNRLGITVPCYSQGEVDSVLGNLVADSGYNADLKEKREIVLRVGNATDNVSRLVYGMLDIKKE